MSELLGITMKLKSFKKNNDIKAFKGAITTREHLTLSNETEKKKRQKDALNKHHKKSGAFILIIKYIL